MMHHIADEAERIYLEYIFRNLANSNFALDQSNNEYEIIGILKGNEYLNNFMFIPIKSIPQQLINLKDENYFPILVSTTNNIDNLKK